MQNQIRSAYQQNEILDATPAQLIVLLYRGALDAIAKAREHQLRGEIRQRSEQITRAFDIVSELAASLDLDKGGELAANLLKLYDYAQHELLRANVEQSAEILGQVETALRNLADGWEAIAAADQQQSKAPVPAAFLGTSYGGGTHGQEPARPSLSLSV